MEEIEIQRRALAGELSFTWGPGGHQGTIRSISIRVVESQAQLIEALYLKLLDQELKTKAMELERDVNADKIKTLEDEIEGMHPMPPAPATDERETEE